MRRSSSAGLFIVRLIARLPDQTTASRYAVATLAAMLAISLQWIIVPLVGVRLPFLFLLIAIGVSAFYCGRGPALLVAAAGAMNAAVQLPTSDLLVDTGRDSFIFLLYGVAAIALGFFGSRLRVLYDNSQQNVRDLERLHELAVQVAQTRSLDERLGLILECLVGLHGAHAGLISLYDGKRNTVTVAASHCFSAAALEKIHEVPGGEGACGAACLERRRVVIEDTERDPRFAPFRELARQEGFRSVHSTPVFGATDEVLGVVSLHFRAPHRPTTRELRLAEICARKLAVHIERARVEELARESDQRLRRVVDSSAIPFVVLAPVRDGLGAVIDFTWTYLNAQAQRALEFGDTELVGRRVSEMLPESGKGSEAFEQYVAVLSLSAAREFEIHSARTGQKWFHIVASPLEGSVAVWFADITERKHREQEMQSADRRKDEFLATLAHELRNPLAPIRQAALLARKQGITEGQREWCNDVIERQVQHMGLLLDDLLDVSRITRGALQLRKQLTALGSLIESAVETARPKIESKKHVLHIDLNDGQARLNVDPLRMAQIISNLLNNAAKYTRAGGVIRLAAHVSEGDLHLSVADNGVGIAPAELPSIFQMFCQVRSSQELADGGLGIGLALTKGLVELHGGSIVAHSAGSGAGSTFTITMPKVVQPQWEAASATSLPTAVGMTHDILLADDNRDAAESLAMLLQCDGHRVVVAHDGETAVELFRAHRPDVVLLDIGMPKLDGFEVAKCIRASAAADDVLLVAITGWGQSTDRANAIAAGFDHHLTKPVDYAVLGELIVAGSQRRRLTQENSGAREQIRRFASGN